MATKYKNSLLLIVLFLGISIKSLNSADSKQYLISESDMARGNQKSVSDSTNAGYLSCKMDGVLLQASFPGGIILYVPSKKEVNIWGKTPTGIISITIDNVESAGTYTIKGNSKNGAGIMVNSKMYEVKKTGTPFTVTIESIEGIKAVKSTDAKAIHGTFKGKFMDQSGKIVEITEGKFSTN
jgi:hypothetical protein